MSRGRGRGSNNRPPSSTRSGAGRWARDRRRRGRRGDERRSSSSSTARFLFLMKEVFGSGGIQKFLLMNEVR